MTTASTSRTVTSYPARRRTWCRRRRSRFLLRYWHASSRSRSSITPRLGSGLWAGEIDVVVVDCDWEVARGQLWQVYTRAKPYRFCFGSLAATDETHTRLQCRSRTLTIVERRTRVRELLEAKRPDEPAVERRNRFSLSKVGYTELFRTSIFVWFALRTRTKPDETEQTSFLKAT